MNRGKHYAACIRTFKALRKDPAEDEIRYAELLAAALADKDGLLGLPFGLRWSLEGVMLLGESELGQKNRAKLRAVFVDADADGSHTVSFDELLSYLVWQEKLASTKAKQKIAKRERKAAEMNLSVDQRAKLKAGRDKKKAAARAAAAAVKAAAARPGFTPPPTTLATLKPEKGVTDIFDRFAQYSKAKKSKAVDRLEDAEKETANAWWNLEVLSEGDGVQHPLRGRGRIVAISPDDDQKVHVEFASGEVHAYVEKSWSKFKRKSEKEKAHLRSMQEGALKARSEAEQAAKMKNDRRYQLSTPGLLIRAGPGRGAMKLNNQRSVNLWLQAEAAVEEEARSVNEARSVEDAAQHTRGIDEGDVVVDAEEKPGLCERAECVTNCTLS